jgi:hypothetical protein
MKASVHHRKPSTINYSGYADAIGTDIGSRMRAVCGKRGFVYLSTILLVGLLYMLFSAGSSSDSVDTDRPLAVPQLEIVPALHGVFQSATEETVEPTPEVEHVIPAIEDSRGTTSDRQTTPDRQTSSGQTNYGFPIVSTRNHGSVVMLTGATGPGHFSDLQDFYPMIVDNRMEYANSRGALAHFSETDNRIRVYDGGFSVVYYYP